MTVDRAMWTRRRFTPGGIISWPCPFCGLPTLKLVPETLHKIESHESIENHNHPAWEPDWIEGRFVCLLKCQSCNESMSIAGEHGVEEGMYYNAERDEYEEDDFDYFQPSFISPPPPIMGIPKTVPEDVKKQLVESFQLFWEDAESCANRIRASVERLLDHQGIKRKRIAKSGKRIPLSLHERIQEFEAKDKALADNLMAVKWLGNAGSHASKVDVDDLLDGYEIMEHVLTEIYTQRMKRINSLTRQINRNRKPRSAQKKKAIF